MSASVWNSVRRLSKLCVVIPAYNEALLVGRCIESVLAAGVAATDIYVIDDLSSDGTGDIVKHFAGVNLVTNQRQLGKLGGLRHAVQHFTLAGRYDFLSLLDADSHVSPSYFIAVLSEFSREAETVLVCGAPQSERYNWLTAYRALEYAVTLKAYRAGQHSLGVITVAPGCASTYRTDILEKFDWDGGTLVEDMDLTVQVHRKRLGHIAFTAEAVAYTQDPRCLHDYIGQLTRWYSGTWQVLRLHRVPFGGQRIDAELTLLLCEGAFYSVGVALVPLLVCLWPMAILRLFLYDQLLWLALAIVCAISLRRLDILINSPSFVLIRAINCLVLLRTFWFEVVRNQRRTDWFSVGRYQDPTSTVNVLGDLNA